MGTVQKTKGGKKMERSARDKPKNAHMRPIHIKRAQVRHLKNARQSCGEEFAAALKEHYANAVVEKRHQGRKK